MAYHFHNLVFEGGGVKGIAYVGALQVLEEKGILPDIIRVGGTSAGAINAVLVGFNYTPAETEQILKKMNFENFMDEDFGLFRDVDRLLSEFGWYKGDFFREWIGELIAQKTGNPNVTFDQVQQQKTARGFGTCISWEPIFPRILPKFFPTSTHRVCAWPTRCASPCRSRFFSHAAAVPGATFTWTAACWTITRSSFSIDSATWTPEPAKSRGGYRLLQKTQRRAQKKKARHQPVPLQ